MGCGASKETQAQDGAKTKAQPETANAKKPSNAAKPVPVDDEQANAAMIIQARHKGNRARSRVSKLKMEKGLETKNARAGPSAMNPDTQANFKKYQEHKEQAETRKQELAAKEAEQEAAIRIQAHIRGHQTRKSQLPQGGLAAARAAESGDRLQVAPSGDKRRESSHLKEQVIDDEEEGGDDSVGVVMPAESS
eukprot:GFYU01013027.1.p1 GENE.GFYU01013027.1~~GFYU01013027.1.p1  ORF type:complete len:193 (-),score=45.73 GFYU01013027.1:195-773(-)